MLEMFHSPYQYISGPTLEEFSLPALFNYVEG